ncbi:MAG: NOL1/NOP2/sun family putative RNA methylase [Ruminiclostridium sp.]|nr:NOL1/NOP2/sun family putative RNA methylase [Ruminiclostridium sp.]
MKLPAEFLDKMKRLLDGNEYDEFMNSYNEPRHYGLRVNTLKITVEEFLKISPFKLEPVPWTLDGFYYPEGENPGKHPYYHAGLYYIQEPSAMLPGAVLEAKPGEKVLDLCAAPGGKTIQIAAAMQNSGIIIANDINADRVKALVKNIELCGVRNAVVLNETPEKIASGFEGYFDRILVDAPCSGEGMFRKDEDAARSWESFKCETCSGMQKTILEHVDRMLKPGGSLVYSTCTFSPEEDERMISYFLNLQNNYEIAEIPKTAGMQPGRPEWSDGNPKLAGTVRLWPHRIKGEGHFAALLKKKEYGISIDSMKNLQDMQAGTVNYDIISGNGESISGNHGKGKQPGQDEPELPLPEAFRKFIYGSLNIAPEGKFILKGRNIYLLPKSIPSLDGLRVAKFGWFLGEADGNRFEPSHSMVTALEMKDLKKVINLKSGSYEVKSYLKGETLMLDGEKGLTAMCVDGYTLGWAKQTGDILKNLYPKGWRKMN